MSIKICWQFTADYRELEALKVFTQEPPRGHDRPLHSGCLTCSPAGYSRSRARLDSPFPLPQSPSGPVGQQTHPVPVGRLSAQAASLAPLLALSGMEEQAREHTAWARLRKIQRAESCPPANG